MDLIFLHTLSKFSPRIKTCKHFCLCSRIGIIGSCAEACGFSNNQSGTCVPHFWSAAIYCRFDIFWIAVRPRTALISRHVSCRSGSAVRLSESESKHRFVSGKASCLLMRMKRYRSTYGMFYTYRGDFLSISFIPERKFGKPKQDFRPSLLECGNLLPL